ncbi:Protein TRANSPORT INHIBITOR RESPONSE 1 [Linum grandiflorum]
MRVTDKSLQFLALKFPNFKALTLLSCDRFSTCGLAAVAAHCRNLTELDIQENGIDDSSGDWISYFPENFNSLEVLNFSNLNTNVNPEVLERLVSRCKSLKVLKVNRSVSLDCLQRLLCHAPQLTELGAGAFSQELTPRQYSDLELAFSVCKNLNVLSGLWEATMNLSAIYPACSRLTFLNLSYAALQSQDLATLLSHCPSLRCLWVLDSVGDKGLEAVGEKCPLLEELRVFPADPFDEDMPHAVTEEGIVVVSQGCWKLHYILYFCRQMTNAAVATGCTKLRKLEIRDCPFGNAVLLSGLEKYESMRSLWMSACNVTISGCRVLARKMPRLNVEVMKEEGSDDCKADKVYVYRTVAGPRRDAPPSVMTISSL